MENSGELTSENDGDISHSENCLNSTLPALKNHFIVDRTCIPTVSDHERENGLCDLDIQVYNQEVLEKEILEQVDKALETQKLRQAEAFRAKQKFQKQDEEESLPKNKSNDEIICSKDKKVECDTFNILGHEETERERKIRMGEMTPFGTVMSSKTSGENSLENIEGYLLNQLKMNCIRKGAKRRYYAKNVKHRKNKEKIPEIIPTKKPKKETTETSFINENICNVEENNNGKLPSPPGFSSGSEYVPTESDLDDPDYQTDSCSPKKKSKRPSKKGYKKKVLSCDSSVDESEDEKSIKKNKGKKELDDGNEEYYLKRLEDWEKSKKFDDIELKEIDNGFKMPVDIWDKLFNYQKTGVQWLWELNLQRCGGILGDEMGLGKTIQVIAFLIGLSVSKLISKHGSFKGLGPVLIVCPTTVMHQWVREFHKWWPKFRVALLHDSGTYNGKRSLLINEIVRKHGILITSYVTCIQQSESLLRYTWHYVVLDEGHKIRNPSSQIASTVKLLSTPHRLILSGSPMQNNLRELWSLFDFIFPGKLGTLPVFMAEFSVPITQGGYANASKIQVATAFKCATVLRDTISPYLLRRVKDDVKGHINLPKKNEQVLFCRLTEEQKELYINYLNSGKVDDILSGKYKVFVGLIDLRKICNHPHLYTGGPKLFKWDNPDTIPEEEKFGFWTKAGKLIVVETLLKIWKKQGHRVLIFTQSRKMLKILEIFVQSKNYEYVKMDGSTSIASRQPLINKFNEDKKYYIFLSTTHVGGLGVNLTGANRVVIYDPDWNPATDTQARERAWRIGQENQVTIYRLVTSGTIEEKIYHRQIFKQFLTNKVLKDPNQRRFFKSNDLYELFTYKDTDKSTETSSIFAGSNVEVNLNNFSHRKKVKEIKAKMNLESESVKKSVDACSILSKKKIERMKALAQNLSRKISLEAQKLESNNCSFSENYKHEAEQTIVPTKVDSSEKVLKARKSYSGVVEHQEETKKHRKRKKSKRKDAVFDGTVVPHLHKQLPYKDLISEGSNHHETDDEYILKKLLSKTGVQSALKHDQIMEGGPADFDLIEVEAEKVAKEAVKALKESRKHYLRCFESQSEKPVKPRFGRKNFGQKSVTPVKNENSSVKNTPMSPTELLNRIRQRNRLCPITSDTLVNPLTKHSELLTDIRNYISFGCEINNRASTQEIINNFRDRLPTSQTPLFKALLNEICEFHRTSSGEGVWELRSEFRW